MPVKERSYQQFCGVARALDLLGGRWTLLIVRNLLLGPRRYGTLLAELPGITTNILASRMKALERAGLVEKQHDDDGATRYALTASGARLEPIVMELGRFGGSLLDRPRRGDALDIAWAFLSLKRRYRGGIHRSVELRVTAGDSVRTVALTFLERYLRVRDRPAPSPSVVVSGDVEAFRDLLFRGVPAEELEARGALVVAGSKGAWHEVLGAIAPAPLAGTGGPDPEA